MRQREFFIHIHVLNSNETECSTNVILSHFMNYEKQTRQNTQVFKYNIHVIHKDLPQVNIAHVLNTYMYYAYYRMQHFSV